jgi:hypothetical protein
MNFGCHFSKKCTNRLATARYDREPAVQNHAAWMERVAAQLRQAITPQVPVGFEDETGFHCGVPWLQETLPPGSAAGNVEANTHQF